MKHRLFFTFMFFVSINSLYTMNSQEAARLGMRSIVTLSQNDEQLLRQPGYDENEDVFACFCNPEIYEDDESISFVGDLESLNIIETDSSLKSSVEILGKRIECLDEHDNVSSKRYKQDRNELDVISDITVDEFASFELFDLDNSDYSDEVLSSSSDDDL